MRKLFLVFSSLFTLFSFGQRINQYEFVVVSTKFQFQRTEHEYRLNALLKDRLQDFGFRSFYKTVPVVNSIDPCLCIDAEVVNVSNIFMTKLQIVFRDCMNGVVFQSEIGTSESKDRHESFNEALNNALKSVRNINYKFTGVKKDIGEVSQNSPPEVQGSQVQKSHNRQEDYLVLQTKIENAKQEYNSIKSKIEKAKLELAATEEAKKEKSKAQQVAIQKAKVSPSQVEAKIAVQMSPNSVKSPGNVVPAKAQPVAANVPAEGTLPVDVTIAAAEGSNTNVSQEQAIVDETKSMYVEKTDGISKEILFAGPVENGYQLIDSTSKVILELVKTLQPEYFNANIEKKYGVVFKKNEQWVFEYYFEGKLVVEQLNIRF